MARILSHTDYYVFREMRLVGPDPGHSHTARYVLGDRSTTKELGDMWTVSSPEPGASRARRRQYRRELAANRLRIRYLWTDACLAAGLAQEQRPPWPDLVPPLVGPITLDSGPARFSVRLRPGQLLDDFTGAATVERLAAAFGVVTVQAAALTPGWITIRLIERAAVEPDDARGLPARPGTAPRNPLGPRTGRGPAGRPRAFGFGRRYRTSWSADEQDNG
jgi:hypothetical protein